MSGGYPIPDITSVDICNIALEGYLGLAPITTIDDAVNTARVCKRMYRPTLEEVFVARDWGFARARAVLVERTMPEAMVDAWGFAYTQPVDVVKILRVVPPGSDRPSDFKVGLDQDVATPVKVIYTNVEDAHLVYTALITDADSMSYTFKTLVALLLAARIAPMLTQSVQRGLDLEARYGQKLREAILADMNEEETTAARESYMSTVGVDKARFGG